MSWVPRSVHQKWERKASAAAQDLESRGDTQVFPVLGSQRRQRRRRRASAHGKHRRGPERTRHGGSDERIGNGFAGPRCPPCLYCDATYQRLRRLGSGHSTGAETAGRTAPRWHAGHRSPGGHSADARPAPVARARWATSSSRPGNGLPVSRITLPVIRARDHGRPVARRHTEPRPTPRRRRSSPGPACRSVRERRAGSPGFRAARHGVQFTRRCPARAPSSARAPPMRPVPTIPMRRCMPSARNGRRRVGCPTW